MLLVLLFVRVVGFLFRVTFQFIMVNNILHSLGTTPAWGANVFHENNTPQYYFPLEYIIVTCYWSEIEVSKMLTFKKNSSCFYDYCTWYDYCTLHLIQCHWRRQCHWNNLIQWKSSSSLLHEYQQEHLHRISVGKAYIRPTSRICYAFLRGYLKTSSAW